MIVENNTQYINSLHVISNKYSTEIDYSISGVEAKCCNELVRLFVCPPASQELYVQLSTLHPIKFSTNVIYGNGGRCQSSDDAVICYVLPIWRRMSCLHIMARNKQHKISIYSVTNQRQHGFDITEHI